MQLLGLSTVSRASTVWFVKLAYTNSRKVVCTMDTRGDTTHISSENTQQWEYSAVGILSSENTQQWEYHRISLVFPVGSTQRTGKWSVTYSITLSFIMGCSSPDAGARDSGVAVGETP